MKTSFSQWSLQSKLALAAFILGAVAVFGDPSGGGAVTIHPRELAAIVEGEVDHVTAGDLSAWILQGRSDYRLIDLRSPEAYAADHIPTAENVPLASLPDWGLERNEKIVLYSDGGIHSAQAWFLLKAQGYGGAYILLGGLDEWKERTLGTAPRTAGTEVTSAPAVAAPRPPAAPAAPAAAKKKKKKEGC